MASGRTQQKTSHPTVPLWCYWRLPSNSPDKVWRVYRPLPSDVCSFSRSFHSNGTTRYIIHVSFWEGEGIMKCKSVGDVDRTGKPQLVRRCWLSRRILGQPRSGRLWLQICGQSFLNGHKKVREGHTDGSSSSVSACGHWKQYSLINRIERNRIANRQYKIYFVYLFTVRLE
jgi:hypothetical protein